MAIQEFEVLETFTTTLRRHAKIVQSSLQAQTLSGMNRCVQLLSQSVDKVNNLAGLEEPEASALREGVLYDAVLPLLYLNEGRIKDAAEVLAGSWHALSGRMHRDKAYTVKLRPLKTDPKETQEVIRMYTLAVNSWVIEKSASDRAQTQIRLLMTLLRLSFDEVGQMLQVNGETVRRWSSGVGRIPENKLALMDVATNALGRLRRLFRAERLPEVIRRPAQAFGGQRALDRILQGRIAEVAEHYERELVYQS